MVSSLDNVKRSLLRQLQTAEMQKAELEKRILGLKQSLHALDALEGTDTLAHAKPLGLTDAVRSVLIGSFRKPAMSAVQVRDELKLSGFDFSHYSSLIASVHVVLKRLVESGEVQPETVLGVGGLYKWAGPVPVEFPGGTKTKASGGHQRRKGKQ